MYSSTFSAWLEANIKTSWTPERARNSRVYSIRGVFARGRRHYKLRQKSNFGPPPTDGISRLEIPPEESQV